jgi:cobalt-zinc-cadmium efflux system membrane fusion protein
MRVMKRKSLVILVLGGGLGLALLLGLTARARGWPLPAWLGFLGGGEAAREDAGLFCEEHGVPEKFCTLCHAELEGELEMCAEHGVPEAVCTLCDPGAAERYGLTGICSAHGLPGHLCPRCNGEVAASDGDPDWCPAHGVPRALCTRCDPALVGSIAMCPRHPVPAALCTVCRPELRANFKLCARHGLPLAFCALGDCGAGAPFCAVHGKDCKDPRCGERSGEAAASALPRVRLASPKVAARAGIETAPAAEADSARVLAAPGEVVYDETRLARIRSPVGGVIREVLLKDGDPVEAGGAILVLDSAELGERKADYLAAAPLVGFWARTLERNRLLGEQQAVPVRAVQEAEAELRRAEADRMRAEQRLRSLGLGDGELAGLSVEPPALRNRITLKAPLAGTVLRRKASAGETVEAGVELCTVADLTQVWVRLDVHEKDLRSLGAGKRIVFRVPGLEPAEFPGKVVWIDSEVDARARTVHVRAEVENKEGLLRAHMFGTGFVELEEARTSLRVPREAVQWEGSSFVVFVKTGAAEFDPRRVLTSGFDGHSVALAWGDLKPGDQVVTTGSFLLKTEIQKGSIGAGCCGE